MRKHCHPYISQYSFINVNCHIDLKIYCYFIQVNALLIPHLFFSSLKMAVYSRLPAFTFGRFFNASRDSILLARKTIETAYNVNAMHYVCFTNEGGFYCAALNYNMVKVITLLVANKIHQKDGDSRLHICNNIDCRCLNENVGIVPKMFYVDLCLAYDKETFFVKYIRHK